MQCILSHTAKNGCGYCTIQGEWFANRVVFPYGPTCPSPTNLKYSTGTENNQISLSPLLGLVDFYGGFPPDYMHAVCLGITRKLFHFFCCPIKGTKLACRLSLAQLSSLSDLAIQTSSFIPAEFQGKLRTFKEIEHFKASEYKTLVLYLGPYLLRNILPHQFYSHFTLLHCHTCIFFIPIIPFACLRK